MSDKSKKDKTSKRKNNIANYKIILEKLQFIFYVIAMIYLYNLISLIECKQRRIQSNDSSIYLKGCGNGDINILSNSYFGNLPNQIFINAINQTTIDRVYHFSGSENNINNVTLIWTNEITTAYQMFRGCSNIIEFDFTFFDISNVRLMASMFSGCTSLTSLNLSNFNTLNVNLMTTMFSGCSSLTLLDLSNFDTSNVVQITGIFSDCLSLKFINLQSASIINDMKTQILQLIPQNITVCGDEENWSEDFTVKKEISCENIDYNNEPFKCFTNFESNKYDNKFFVNYVEIIFIKYIMIKIKTIQILVAMNLSWVII